MVEVEIVRSGKEKVGGTLKTKLELLKFPLFRRNSYSYDQGRLDAEWLEVKEADYLFCIARFHFNTGATIRVTAKESIIFVPFLLNGDIELATDDGKVFEIFSLQYSLLTLWKQEYLKITNNGERGFLLLLVLQMDYFAGMEPSYHTAEKLVNGSYNGYKHPFILIPPSLQQMLKYILGQVTANSKIDRFNLSSSLRTVMAAVLTGIDKLMADNVYAAGHPAWQVSAIQKIENYLQENFEQFPGMEAVAKMVTGMNLTIFRKLFVDITGSGVYAYWDSHRMGLAWNWLSTKQFKPMQVAVILGFASSQAFNKQFKKHYAVAPSKVYRKKN